MSLLAEANYASLLTGVGVAALFFFLQAYRSLFDSLSKVPLAHWSCAFSPAWILLCRYQRRELMAVHAAHKLLGPIVRVGPKEISVSCYETGVRSVYNAGFDKPHYYSFYQYYGQLNSFASRSRADHTACRKRVSAVYSKSYLFGSQALRALTEKILLGRLFPRLAQDAQASEPTELLRLSYPLSLDLLNCFIFGLSSGPNFTQDNLLTRAFLEHYENRYCREGFWSQELPSLTSALGMFGVDMLPRRHHDSTVWIENWMMIHCNRAHRVCELMDEGELPADPADIPIVYQQIRKFMRGSKAHDKPCTEKQLRLSIASELFDHMSGAREVFGLVLAYTIYYIASHPAEQSRLRSELGTLDQPIPFPGNPHADGAQPRRLSSPQSLVQLTYLTAVIKESLRMRPNSTPLPRVTPSDRSVTIVGVEAIPPGTRVNCFQWFLHRDPEKWSKPNEWVPERWLREDGSEKDKTPPLWAFASGPRRCIGDHLTYYLFRYILAVIFSNFSARVVRPEIYGLHPPGSLDDKLFAVFEPLQKSHCAK